MPRRSFPPASTEPRVFLGAQYDRGLAWVHFPEGFGGLGLNPKLQIHGVVLTMYDPRNNLANQVAADVRRFMGDKVYETMIPRNVRVSEAPSHGKPVLLYDLKCSGSQAYLKLASEVIQREKRLRAA